MSSSDIVLVSASSAEAFVIPILTHYGVPQDRALLIANSLVLADLRSVDTHGINRLGGYLDRIKNGVLDPNPPLSFEMKTPVMAHLDAKNTFGFVVASLAIDEGVKIASTYGVGIVVSVVVLGVSVVT
jgi:LDH2 family malate/lactate/ureidoglycolate dehydrogenase